MYVMSYLVAQGYDIEVITEDDNVKTLAGYYNLPIVTFDTMGEYDLFICCHGRKIIDKKYMTDRMINIHPCLYKYKGHNPIKRYIANKDKRGSVEAQWMIEEVDAGDVIYREEFDTGQVHNYAEFYNIAAPHYFSVIHNTLKILQ